MVQAIAGCTKLDIYTIGLQGPKIDDNVLLTLMRSVPKRAVLLFEDIDSAGIGRESAEEDESPKVVGETGDKALEEPKPKFTMSGLLNAIDGAQASHGHIIIIMSEFPHEHIST
jgi:mitochondrial chaperone BCS1